MLPVAHEAVNLCAFYLVTFPGLWRGSGELLRAAERREGRRSQLRFNSVLPPSASATPLLRQATQLYTQLTLTMYVPLDRSIYRPHSMWRLRMGMDLHICMELGVYYLPASYEYLYACSQDWEWACISACVLVLYVRNKYM